MVPVRPSLGQKLVPGRLTKIITLVEEDTADPEIKTVSC